jgi:hypothetical protein
MGEREGTPVWKQTFSDVKTWVEPSSDREILASFKK